MKSGVNKKIVAVASSVTLALCFASGLKAGVSEQGLKCFFKSIVYDGTNYVFVGKPGFVYRVDNSRIRACKDGEIITLSPNSELNIMENHSSLLVLPLPIEDERRGLVLSLNTDVRSFGGGVTTNYAYLVVAAEESDSLNGEKGLSGTNTVARTKASVAAKASAPEKQFMKGLKLLPCD